MVSRSTLPASSFEISRMSLIRASSASALSRTATAHSRCSGVKSVCSSSPFIPMTPFIGVRISCDMLARKFGFGAVGAFGGFSRLLRLPVRRGDLLFGGLAVGDVGEGPDRPAAGQRNVAELDHPAIGPPPLAHPRLFERSAAPDDLLQRLVAARIPARRDCQARTSSKVRLRRHQLLRAAP